MTRGARHDRSASVTANPALRGINGWTESLFAPHRICGGGGHRLADAAQAPIVDARYKRVCVDPTDQGMSASRSGTVDSTERNLALRLRGFAWETLEEEAAREGLSTEKLVAFSVLYYLADVDSGRISRQVSKKPYPSPLSGARQDSQSLIGTDSFQAGLQRRRRGTASRPLDPQRPATAMVQSVDRPL
jgi:hypothetical protein